MNDVDIQCSKDILFEGGQKKSHQNGIKQPQKQDRPQLGRGIDAGKRRLRAPEQEIPCKVRSRIVYDLDQEVQAQIGFSHAVAEGIGNQVAEGRPQHAGPGEEQSHHGAQGRSGTDLDVVIEDGNRKKRLQYQKVYEIAECEGGHGAGETALGAEFPDNIRKLRHRTSKNTCGHYSDNWLSENTIHNPPSWKKRAHEGNPLADRHGLLVRIP